MSMCGWWHDYIRLFGLCGLKTVMVSFLYWVWQEVVEVLQIQVWKKIQGEVNFKVNRLIVLDLVQLYSVMLIDFSDRCFVFFMFFIKVYLVFFFCNFLFWYFRFFLQNSEFRDCIFIVKGNKKFDLNLFLNWIKKICFIWLSTC